MNRNNMTYTAEQVLMAARADGVRAPLVHLLYSNETLLTSTRAFLRAKLPSERDDVVSALFMVAETAALAQNGSLASVARSAADIVSYVVFEHSPTARSELPRWVTMVRSNCPSLTQYLLDLQGSDMLSYVRWRAALLRCIHPAVHDCYVAVNDNGDKRFLIVLTNHIADMSLFPREVALPDDVLATMHQVRSLPLVDDALVEGPLTQADDMQDTLHMDASQPEEPSLSDDDMERVLKAADEATATLFARHPLLSAVIPSAWRLRGRSEVLPGACLALYVRTKGWRLPQEELLPTEIMGVPVDVRHGEYISSGGHGTIDTIDNSETLRPGMDLCDENDQHVMTIGTFAKKRDSAATRGILTAAHGIHNSGVSYGYTSVNSPESRRRVVEQDGSVIAPLDSEGSWHHPENIQVVSSLDAAFLPLDSRVATEQCFGITLSRKEQRKTKFTYPLPRPVAEIPEDLGDGRVWKIGAASRLTCGRIVPAAFENATVLELHPEIRFQPRNEPPRLLRNMILVASEDDDYFSERGDSGALVWRCSSDGSKALPIGLILGRLKAAHSIVTPIRAICSALQVDLLGE